MTPEERAREKIDQWFKNSGWKVINRNEHETTMHAVAIREDLLNHNLEADYLLVLDNKAVGVLEAKSVNVDISSDKVTEQVTKYANNFPEDKSALQRPLPMLFKSNGKDILFKDYRNRESDWQSIDHIYSPKEICKLLNITDFFAGLPTLEKKGLRKCQWEAINNLEESFRQDKKRALIVLATGAGKTFTACMSAYRFLSYTPMRRILYLVDRNNLGKQAETGFGTFRLTENGEPFNAIFGVERLHSSNIPTDANVVISTIQRLFSLLKGENISDNDDDDQDDAQNIVLPDNPKLPHDYFDLIIIDESHRSIYGNWRKVLEYFDTALLVGLTATPIPDTMAFFNDNRVINYTLQQSIVDNINVDARIYRIKTKVTDEGGAIKEGDKVEEITLYTGQSEMLTIAENQTRNYTPEELNRSIINPAQIELILRTYRDDVYSQMFADQQREENYYYLPKTLIFALNEAHATNITNIAREVFKEKCPKADMNRYVQKITYSANNSNDLIRQFRNDKDFRIAVTCTLVATGTDVPPLEVVMFMRDVQSSTLYVQMKGRGVRTLGDDVLQTVTPNARSKDYYILVDAVGVTEHQHEIGGSGGGEPNISLETLLEKISRGYVPDMYLNRLAATLSRLYYKAIKEQKENIEKFRKLSGKDMKDMASEIYQALQDNKLPIFISADKPNEERKKLVAPLTDSKEARELLLEIAKGTLTILMPGEDIVIEKGFTHEEAEDLTKEFENYCNEHKDKIEALRIIYNNQGEPITYNMLEDLRKNMLQEDSRFNYIRLWNCYSIIKPENVQQYSNKEVREALTNVIQLVRYAYQQITQLTSIVPSAHKNFNLWCGQKQRNMTEQQQKIMKQIVDYVASNGYCTITDLMQIDSYTALQVSKAFSGAENANKAIYSMYKFITFDQKTA